MITQAELNDLFRDLDLPKSKAQFLGSKLQQWDLLENGVKVSLCRKRQENFAMYFSVDGDPYCNDVCGLMEELQLQHVADQWTLFINSSKLSLKAVLLHNGNNTSYSCSPHERNLRQHSKFAARKKMVRRPKVKHICKTERCDIADWAARNLYEILLLPA